MSTMWMSPTDPSECSQSGDAPAQPVIADAPVSQNDQNLPVDQLQPPLDNLDFSSSLSSVLNNSEGLHMPSSTSHPKYSNPPSLSPMQFDFGGNSSMMPSPQAQTVVPQGPSSTQSNVSGSFQNSSQYLGDYSHMSSSNDYSMAQQYSVAPYGRNNGYSTDDIDYQTSFDSRQFNAPSAAARYHPYGRSPQASPSVVKDEPIIKTETQEILDLDSQRLLHNSTHTTAVPQLSGGTMSQIWRPVDQQHHSNSPTLPHMPLTGSLQQSMPSSSMFAGSSLHPQHSPTQNIVNRMPHSYSAPVPSHSYHPQGYAPPPSAQMPLMKPSPNYLGPESQQSPSLPHPQPPVPPRPASDGPPTEYATNVKRPKNFKCEVCRKWFTSQGHLKRHYNTTLHKNMEKQKENQEAENNTLPTPPVQNSILQPSMSPAMSPAMGPAMSPAMGSAMSPAMGSAMSPAIPSHATPETPIVSSSPRLQNGISSLSNHDSATPLSTTESEEKPALVNPTPLSYHMSNDIQYSQTNEQNIQYQSSYGQPPYEPVYNDFQNRPQGIDVFPAASSNSSPLHHHNTQSTMYHGHFSSSSTSMVNAAQSIETSTPNSYSTQFFQQGPTPMAGGGTSYVRPDNSNVRPVISPPLPPSSLAHLSSYNVTNHTQFSGISSSNSSNNYFTLTTSDAFTQNRSQNRFSPSDSINGEFGEKVDSIIDEFGSITSLQASESEKKLQGLQIYADSDGRPPSNSPEVRAGSALDSTSDGSRDSTSTTASGVSASGANPVKVKESKEVKCPDCGKVCASPCYLTQHRKRHHAGVLDFKCEKCGKKFSERTAYDEHVAKHAGDKPYKCIECPKQFNHKTDLRRHSCLHTGEKPFHCPICKKGFIRKDHMMKHQNTHEKKRLAAVAAASANSGSRHMPVSMNGGLPGLSGFHPPTHMGANPPLMPNGSGLIPEHFVPSQYSGMGHPHLPPPPHHNSPSLPPLSQHPSTLPAVY